MPTSPGGLTCIVEVTLEPRSGHHVIGHGGALGVGDSASGRNVMPRRGHQLGGGMWRHEVGAIPRSCSDAAIESHAMAAQLLEVTPFLGSDAWGSLGAKGSGGCPESVQTRGTNVAQVPEEGADV